MIRKAVPLAVGLLAFAPLGYALDITTIDAAKPVAQVAAPGAPGNWAFGTCSGTPFSDNFDSYPLGNICGLGGWEPWTPGADVCGLVSNEQANSGANSLKIIGNVGGGGGAGGDDQVHQFDIVGGVWTFKVMTFVPQDATGQAWVILLNQFVPGGVAPTNWSLQVHLNAGTNVVHVDFTNEETALIKGRWVEFRAEIDMPNDSVDYYYDGVQFVFGKSWTAGVSGGGLKRIAAVDLYADEPGAGTSGTYFDDISLQGGCGGCGFDPCDTDCDGDVDAFDIEPFINVLLGGFGSGCSPCSGDVDGDGDVDAFDIEPFIACLVGP